MPIVVAALAVAAALGGMALWLGLRAPPAKPVARAESVPSSAPREVDPMPSVTAAVAVPARPIEVVIRIETNPPKAHVFVDGVDRGVSPIDLRVPRATAVTELEIRREGYQTQREKVTPEMDQKIKLTLAPTSGVAPPKPSASANTYKRFD